MPDAVKVASPELSVNPEMVELVELVDNVNVLVPVLNVGAEGTVGSGKNNAVSYTHLTLPTTVRV